MILSLIVYLVSPDYVITIAITIALGEFLSGSLVVSVFVILASTIVETDSSSRDIRSCNYSNSDLQLAAMKAQTFTALSRHVSAVARKYGTSRRKVLRV